MDPLAVLHALNWDAQVHRETYIAVLNGALQARGSKRTLAARAGISPQYLSYLLNPYDHRTPSPTTAEMLVAALNLTATERQDLLEHMHLARTRQAAAVTELHCWLAGQDAANLVAPVAAMLSAARFAQEPKQARLLRHFSALAARTVLAYLDPVRMPLAYAETALKLHEIAAVEYRRALALYWAKQARAVLEQADPDRLRDTDAHYPPLLTNAIRSEAVACQNLHLARMAYNLVERAETTPDARRHPELWLPHLYRDKLAALAGLRRSAAGEAEGLAQRGLAMCEQSTDPFAPLLALLLERGLAHVYLAQQRVDPAAELLVRLMDRLDRVPHLGPLDRMMVLIDYAAVLWQQQDRGQWQVVVQQAVGLGLAARLVHQLHRLRSVYGQDLLRAAGSRYEHQLEEVLRHT
jgi:hypothetical protein